MGFFFTSTEQTKNLCCEKITLISSKLWLSTEAEPSSGLTTPSPAAGGCLVYFGPLFIPSCSSRCSPGVGGRGRVGETLPVLLRILDVSAACSPAPLYSSCSVRRTCGFRN